MIVYFFSSRYLSCQSQLFFLILPQVEFVIEYTGRGELTSVTVNVVLTDADPNQILLQTHSVQFKVDRYSQTFY